VTAQKVVLFHSSIILLQCQ